MEKKTIISTDWCKNVLWYHLTWDINTRIQLKVTPMIQTQMTFQAELMLCDTVAGCVCAHTSCSPDLLSVSHLLHIHQSLTAATNSGLCRYVSVCSERTDIWPGWPWQKLVSGLAFVKRNLDQTPQTKGQRSREAATLTRTSYPPRNLLPSLSPRCVSSVMQKRVCGLHN